MIDTPEDYRESRRLARSDRLSPRECVLVEAARRLSCALETRTEGDLRAWPAAWHALDEALKAYADEKT